jgi:hypothetical protein
MSMSPLSIAAMLLGLFLVAARLPGVIAPQRFRQRAVRFPRSVLWGRVLFAIVALWAGTVMFLAATDEWARLRVVIVAGVPLAYWLVINYAEQYLAVRSLAALSLLVCNLLLRAADLSEHPLRLIVTTLAYLWVLGAVWVTIAPHHLRDLVGFLMANDRRCRASCGAGVGLGALLVALGLLVY